MLCPSLDDVAAYGLDLVGGKGDIVGDGPVAVRWRSAAPGSDPGVRLVDLEAGELAGQLRAWREDGWNRRVVAGPDAFRAWFGDLAGEAGEGATVIACVPPGAARAGEPPPGDGDGTVLQAHAALATMAALAIVEAVAATVAAGEEPARATIQERLLQNSYTGELKALTLHDSRWQ